MSITITQTITVLQVILQGVPLGTNLALLQLMWTILNGSFLSSRGAIFPALKANGFNEVESRRIWCAFRHGVWHINDLVKKWQEYVQSEGQWQSHEYEGYRPLAVDWTAIWRFKLKGWSGKLFNGLLGRAMRGVSFGLVCQVGEIEGQRMPLLKQIIRTRQKNKSETCLKEDTLRWVKHHLGEKEVAIVDAGVELSAMHQAGIARYVIRLAKNVTARRNFLPTYKGRGRYPTWGEKVRPLPRQYGNNLIEASPPDQVVSFLFQGREIVAHGWTDLVETTHQPSPDAPTFSIWVFFDPLYETPLVLGTNLIGVDPRTLFSLYLDRWPVEQVPLVAKQILGLHRQFVFAPESCQRLPELAFLLGNILTYLALVLPPLPTGFWDRCPKKHPVASVVIYLVRYFLKIGSLTPNFAKRSQPRGICPKALTLIVGKNRQLSSPHQFITVFQPIF